MIYLHCLSPLRRAAEEQERKDYELALRLAQVCAEQLRPSAMHTVSQIICAYLMIKPPQVWTVTCKEHCSISVTWYPEAYSTLDIV